jgi:uncharacterized coiled-coil protein SlyX
MSDAIIVALLGFAGTLLGSLFGILAAQKLTQYRIVKLEEKTALQDEKHDDLNTRTHKLEGRMDEAEHEIRDLKKHHQPK